MTRITLTFAMAAFVVLGANSRAEEVYAPGEPVHGDFKDIALVSLDEHCIGCHDDITAEVDLNLLDLGPVDETNAAIWKSLWAQIPLQEMPPKKQGQPEVIERLQFADSHLAGHTAGEHTASVGLA